MATQQQIRDTVRTAQAILREFDPTLQIDGRWGKFTNGVYANAPKSLQLRIDAVLAVSGLNANQLFTENQLMKRSGDIGYLNAKAAARAERGHVQAASAAEVERAIANASQQIGIPINVLKGFVHIESRGRSNAVNGSSRGLFQMQPAAWQDAKKIVPTLGDYNASWADPVQNALAGAAYIKVNQQVLTKLGYSGAITPAVLYLAHQQGAAGFTELYKISQGLNPRTNYVTTEKMLRNPPPDGRGPTTNKKEFYDRWMSIAERKTAIA